MKKTCTHCALEAGCRESAVSWIFLFIGLVATISIRAVNLVLDISSLWAKIFWYTGVAGFFIYFLYKFRSDRRIQKEMARIDFSEKLKHPEQLTEADREFIKGVLCSLKSKKDTINYFFIFTTSGLALLFGLYKDLLK
jgi:hypothetical protein